MIDYDDISPELKEKAKKCKTPEEILALAESEGLELSDEDLGAVSGGWERHCDVDCLDGNCYSCKKKK